MLATDLLRSLDPLSYGERTRRLAEQALRLRGTPELETLLEELGRGSSYERIVGLQVAQIAGHTAYVERLLADPEPAVQARALAAVSPGVSDAALRRLYDDAPAALRGKLLKVLRRTGRRALAADLIDEQRDKWGDQAAASLLVGTDTQTVSRLLPDLAYCLGPSAWRRLAQHHPTAVLTYAAETMPPGNPSVPSSPTALERREWWQGPGYGVASILVNRPADESERALGLLEAALAEDELPEAMVGVVGRLADLAPSWLLKILLAPERANSIHRAVTPAFRRRLHRFSDEELGRLAERLWPYPAGAQADLTRSRNTAVSRAATDLLSDLAPSRRTAVFRAATTSVDLGQAVLPGSLLEVLPRAERHAQARRMLGLAALREDPRLAWEITAYLPFEEAFAVLEPEIRRPDADDRAAVYQAVISSAGHSRQPALVGQALTWAARVRNDRDPVRSTVLTAVADLPPSLLSDEHVEPLQTLLTDALEARDGSPSSRYALTRLAKLTIQQGALRNQPALLRWGIDAHARLTGDHGVITLHGLVDGLPHGHELAVYEALRPYVEAGADRLEFGLTFAVADGFERRGWAIEHLQGVLERAVWSNQEFTVSRAAGHWLRPGATRAERVGSIVARDVGMLRWDPVWYAVTAVRTDLLDVAFAAPERTRRFDRNHPAWYVSPSTLHRWLPRQHTQYADLLAAAASDDQLPDRTRAAAVATLGTIPGIGRAAVTPFLDSTEVLVQEAALGSLAWTDRPNLALPLLLGYAGDDRARVAVYAATRAARFVRPSLLSEALKPLLVGDGVKVTARKEAARLLGELRAPGASVVLGEAWPTAHRDVRAAITSAASQYLLHETASWALLQQAVHDSAATAAVLAQRNAYGLPAKHRSRYADLVIAVTGREEPEVVRQALVALRWWAPWNPAAAPVCASFITDLGRSRAWSDAISSLVAITAAEPGRSLDEVVGVARQLARLENDPDTPDATADRDHPARQRLAVLVDRLAAAFRHKSPATKQTLRTVSAELADFLPLQLQLLTAALDWSSTGTTLADLTTIADLVTDRPLAAATAGDLLASNLATHQESWTPEQLAHPATLLAASSPPPSDPGPSTPTPPGDAQPGTPPPPRQPATAYGKAHSPGAAEQLDPSELARGLFAQVLVAAAGPRSGWSPEWRRLLVALRNYPAADVRQRALDLTTAQEI